MFAVRVEQNNFLKLNGIFLHKLESGSFAETKKNLIEINFAG